ncbi:unnamed protein product, partial [marine sediment metagenome]
AYLSSLPNPPKFLLSVGIVFQSSSYWAGLVEKKDKQEFVDRMKALRSRLEEGNPDFGKAYENMYKIVEGL